MHRKNQMKKICCMNVYLLIKKMRHDQKINSPFHWISFLNSTYIFISYHLYIHMLSNAKINIKKFHLCLVKKMFMDSSSSSSSLSITREELNAFHSFDRALFTRIVISLKEDITQSFQVMTFLIYLDRSVRGSKLISDLVSLPDLSISTIVDEVQICRRCLSYTHFPTFLASMGSINAASIPWIRRMTSEKLTLAVIHLNRNEIILEMTDILNTICYPAFEDICVLFETHKERKFIQFLCGQQGTSNRVAAGASNVEGQHVRADDRTVFLKFSKGYPISEAEVHDYFTRYWIRL